MRAMQNSCSGCVRSPRPVKGQSRAPERLTAVLQELHCCECNAEQNTAASVGEHPEIPRTGCCGRTTEQAKKTLLSELPPRLPDVST